MVLSELLQSGQQPRLTSLRRLATLWEQKEHLSPDEWARKNRVYPPSHGRPGPRDPGYTPYIIPFERFFEDPRYEICALITGTQASKTDGVLDIIGWRLATRPRPQLYVGPSRDFVSDQFEPRLMALLDEAPGLAQLVARGKRNKKTRKLIAGVPVRLAWAGSETALSSDQAGDVYVDEFDKMIGGRKGTGDPLGLAKARSDTYRDRKIVVTSTPKRGLVETEKDAATGLEFWKVAEKDDVESPIWAQWQLGTRHHWAWQCPHCNHWFVPRISCLRWPEGASPTKARRSTWVECPTNGCVIEESEKAVMNAGGRFVAPGMTIDDNDVIGGDPPDNTMLSLWVSGLASPFLSWGERVEELLRADASGDGETKQAARNKIGELWTPIEGEALSWQEIQNRAEPYEPLTFPDAAIFLVLTVDVQQDRLVFVTRAWGARATSWLVEAGYLLGDTAQTPVWGQLAEKITTPIEGVPIKLVFIDSGFRPGKKFALPINRVYQFCRRFRGLVWPTKGSSISMRRPLLKVKPDVNRQADIARYGLELIRLDTDHWKRFVHERLAWPVDEEGAWHIHGKVDEDYCRQLVSEVRVIGDSGHAQWIEKSRNNHFLDCEAMNAAGGFMLNSHHLKPGARRREETEAGPPVPETPAAAAVAKKPKFSRFAEMAARLNR